MPDNYPGAGRRVYPGFLQHTGFVAMNPDRHTSSHYDYFKSLTRGDEASAEQHRKFYDEYNAVLDLDAPYYLQTIRVVFQDFSLVRGTWDMRNPEGQLERVRPQDIKDTALLTIEGELDDISGIGQTQAAHDLCTSIAPDARQHLEIAGAGHYGIFSGSRWRKVVYPQVREFILRHHPKPSVPAQEPVEEVAPPAEKTTVSEQKQFEIIINTAQTAPENANPATVQSSCPAHSSSSHSSTHQPPPPATPAAPPSW